MTGQGKRAAVSLPLALPAAPALVAGLLIPRRGAASEQQAPPESRGSGDSPGVSMTADIFTEPTDFDVDTLRNLGPLSALAGVWEGEGTDRHPVAEGAETQTYRERMVFQPIDPQTNGPQLLYGLRYHVHITRAGERLTFHDQIGYWLWEPATGAILQTLAIPRGQVALARGSAERDARTFTVKATLGSPTAGIVSSAFLTENFLTLGYVLTMFVNSDSIELRAGHAAPGRRPWRVLPPRRPEHAAASGTRD